MQWDNHSMPPNHATNFTSDGDSLQIDLGELVVGLFSIYSVHTTR